MYTQTMKVLSVATGLAAMNAENVEGIDKTDFSAANMLKGSGSFSLSSRWRADLSGTDSGVNNKVILAPYKDAEEREKLKKEMLDEIVNGRAGEVDGVDSAEVVDLKNIKVLEFRLLQEDDRRRARRLGISEDENGPLYSKKRSLAPRESLATADFEDKFFAYLKNSASTPSLGAKAEPDMHVDTLEQLTNRLNGIEAATADQMQTPRKLYGDYFNDPSYNNQWMLKAIEAEQGYDKFKELHAQAVSEKDWPAGWAQRTIVAVIDTGVANQHPDLKSVMWHNPDEIPGNGIDDDGNGIVDDIYGANFQGIRPEPDGDDDHYHGTHCAGIIAAQGNNNEGIAGTSNGQAALGFQPNPNPFTDDLANPPAPVQLMSCKFLGQGGGSLSGGLKCIEYTTEKGADISSNSWGGGGERESLTQAIQEFNDNGGQDGAGGLFISAAGNDNRNVDQSPKSPCVNKASCSICVASTDRESSGMNFGREKMSSFSNWGTKVDVAAPGSSILSSVPTHRRANGYDTLSGTSMACPVVSGVAAMVKSIYGPNMSNDDLYNTILDPAALDDLANSDKFNPSILNKPIRTQGRINPGKALTVAASRFTLPGAPQPGDGVNPGPSPPADPQPPSPEPPAPEPPAPEPPAPEPPVPEPPTTTTPAPRPPVGPTTADPKPPSPTTTRAPVPDPKPPATSTTTPAPSPPGQCEDDPNFQDYYFRDCSWYERYSSWACGSYAARRGSRSNPDYTANEACTVCGGGINCETTQPPDTKPPATTARPPIGTTPTPTTSAPPATTGRPPIGSTTQTPTTSSPPATTGRPPIGSTTQTPTTSSPPATTGRPPIGSTTQTPTTSSPPATTGRPPIGSTTQTPTTSSPPVTTRPPVVTTRPPTVTTRPPTVTTRPPTVTTRPPTVTTRPPTVTTRPPVDTTRPPTVTTRPPTVTTRPPTVTTRPPTVTTRPPVDTTRPPIGTTGPPATSPPATTSAPPTTSPPGSSCPEDQCCDKELDDPRGRTCDHYTTYWRCRQSPEAQKACCYCGGGEAACVSDMTWRDRYGHDCYWYQHNRWGASRCSERRANRYKNKDGVSARDVCCACMDEFDY